MSDGSGLRIHLEWESAPGVATPELAATWARLTIWVDDRCITGVEDKAGAFRRSVYTSVYPLAEWIAFNWWSITSEVRPSAVSPSAWAWANVARLEWLRRHNFRAAGNGMPWPDLTIVPEGALVRAVWRSGPGLAKQPVSFVSSGSRLLPADATVTELARFVDQTLDRLRDAGLGDTPLAKEWRVIRESDAEEVDFARAAARLGVDPYSMDDAARDDLLRVAGQLSPPLLDEFLDSTEIGQFDVGLQWLERARAEAERLHRDGRHSLFSATDLSSFLESGSTTPWERGYEAARRMRRVLGLSLTTPIEIDPLVLNSVVDRSGGLPGLATADAFRQVVLVLPLTLPTTATRFAQARALGLLVFGGERREFLLDPAGSNLTKQSRAFAAELLAPAAGIAEMMSTLPSETDVAFEAVARRYGASPLMVRHQYENQLIA